MDAQFITAEITSWCNTRQIAISQPAPYEHEQNEAAECLIKHLREEVDKVLISMELPRQYWGMALADANDLRNQMPSTKDPKKSRAVLWGKPKASMRRSPLIPFGSRVIAHLPLKLQTPLSTRGFQTIAVGRASYTKGGIRLFNPETKRIILRRTFKVMSQLDHQPTSMLDSIDVEISLGADMDTEPSVEETGGITQDSGSLPDLPDAAENPGYAQ